MNPKRLLLLSTLLAASLCAACQTATLANRAVVIYDRGRMADAERVRNLLARRGVVVEMQVRGPVPRKGSSIAVYDVGRNPSRPDEIAALLGEVGEFDVMPFPSPNGTTDVVVWLEQETP